MRKTLISYYSLLIFAQAALQGNSQTPSSSAATATPTAALDSNTSFTAEPALSSLAPTFENATQHTQTAAPVEVQNVTSGSAQNSSTSAPPTVNIVLEGFVTSDSDMVELTKKTSKSVDSITMTDPTIETTTNNFTWNATATPAYRDSDLTLSFISSSSHVSTAAVYMPSATTAAIVAGVFCSVAIVGYGGLLVWKRVLEKRYGNRELLVNEEFYDVNGMKYFEL